LIAEREAPGLGHLREIAHFGGDQGDRQQVLPQEISMPSSQSDFEVAGSFHRETVHDLRNLFTVIVCARRLLGKDRASARGERLLAAIEDAAFRGSQLTMNLLARDALEAAQTARIALTTEGDQVTSGGKVHARRERQTATPSLAF
jgi:hypothetical protein